MANPSKRKGTEFEVLVADYLAKVTGLPVERRALCGVNDRGDIAGIRDWTLECKATAQIDLAGGLDEAVREMANAKTRFHALIVKRRMKPASQAYAVMTLEQLAYLIGQVPSCPT